MSNQPRALARRRLRILGLTALVGVLIVAGLYGGWKVRKELMVRRALADGLAAYEQSDWETARLNLGRYISVHQDDADVLRKYAYAQLSMRPVKPENLRQAIGAYRKVLALHPVDDDAFRRLVLLYESTNNFGELSYIAGKRLEARPDDPAALIAQAKDLLFREKRDAARTTLEGLVTRLAAGQGACDEFVEACVLLSGLPATGSRNDAGPQPLAWLEQAVARCPDSALARAQRAARRQILATSQPAAADEHRRAARADLDQAEACTFSDPRVRLLLSEQWLALREYDKAATQLAVARTTPWAEVERYFVDPAHWSAAVFVQEAKLALLTGDTAGGVTVAQRILKELEDRAQQAAILPLAIELYVAGGRTAEARQCLDDYVEQLTLRGRLSPGDEQLAWLRAVIAQGEDKPYEVIEHLAPLAQQSGARPMIQTLLAEAYLRTGQPARAARLFERTQIEAAINPRLTRLAVRVQLDRGDWPQVLTMLRALESSAGDDPELATWRIAAELSLADQQGGQRAADAIAAAHRDLSTLRARHPDYLLARLLLASVTERLEGLAAAEQVLKEAIEECQEPFGAYRALARLYASNQRPDDARRTLELACERCAGRAAPWLALSEFLVESRQVEEARKVLHTGFKTLSPGPAQTALRQRRALLDLLNGDRVSALATLQELAAADPQDIRTRALLLEQPEIAGDDAAAQALVEEIRRCEGAAGVTWRLAEARRWLQQPDWRARREQVEAHLKYCLDADPSLTAPVVLLGVMFEELGEAASAETTYANGFNSTGSIDVADRLLALLSRQRRFTEARDVLQRMQQTLSSTAASARRLALDIDEERYDSALLELRTRLTAAERDPLDLVRLAWVSYAQNREPNAALRALDEAATAGAAPLAVARVRTAILQDQGRADEVVAVLDALIAADPTPEAFLLRGGYHTSAGRMDLAEQDYSALARAAQNDYGVAVLGEFYAQTGRFDRAIEEWEAGLAAYPDSQMLKRGLAKAYLTRAHPGDQPRADVLLAELEQDLPGDVDLIWVRALEAAQAGTPESLARARELLASAAQGATTRVEVYHGLCELAFRLNALETTRDLAARGLQVHPGDTRLLLTQARTELAIGRLDAARERAQTVLTRDSASLAALEILLDVAARQADHAALRAGLGRLDEHIAATPDNEFLHILKARTQLALGEPACARETLTTFCDTPAGRMSVPALLALQDVCRLTGDLDAAQLALEAAAAREPDHRGVLLGRILLLSARQQYDEIVRSMSTLAVDDENADVLLTAATSLAASPTHLEQAIGLCDRAATLAPQNVAALLLLGDLEYQRGHVAAAQRAYRAALQLQPALPVALNNLAWVLAAEGGELDEALTLSRQAVAQEPADPNFRDTLAFVLRQAGRAEEARLEYRRSAELAPPKSAQRARSLYHQAQVSAQLEDWPVVASCLHEALAAGEGQTVFAPDERAEIDRLLVAAQQPRP